MSLKLLARRYRLVLLALAMFALISTGFAQIDSAAIATDAETELQTVIANASPFIAYGIVVMLSIRWVRRIFMSA